MLTNTITRNAKSVIAPTEIKNPAIMNIKMLKNEMMLLALEVAIKC